MTPSGEVDRKGLPAPVMSALSREQAYVSPRTPIKELLVEIWRAALKLECVGVEDNFFDLGGHSLLATQVVSRVRQAVGVEILLQQLFVSPTIAGLAD